MRADVRRVYGLDITTLGAWEAAQLAANLPDGSMVWRTLDVPRAWTMDQHLLATLVDQWQMWMWGQSDPKHRGRKPRPLPRPGDGKTHSMRDDTLTMSADRLDAFLAQEFTDTTMGADMAIKLAEAYVQIVPSMQGVGNAIVSAFDGASGKAGLSGGKAAGSGFAGGLKARMGAVIGAASAITSKAMDTIGSSISSAVSRADQMNNFSKVMKNLGYSSEDAAKSIKKISDSLDGLPTTSSAMTGMVQQLAPLTSNLDEATTISLAFNNAMLAGGASTMEQENALAQYTQMLSAGTVDMAAWRSIQAAMPGQLNQVAEAMMGAGHNANDLYEAMKDGTYSFDDFNQAIVDLNQNGFGQYASFAQQAKDATQGIGTAIENVKNRVAKAVQKVVEAFGVENIAGAINGFSSQFGKIGDAAANVVTFTKDQLSDLWSKVQDTGALDDLKMAWDDLVSRLSGIDWGSLIPTKVFEGFKWTVASATRGVIDQIVNLIDMVSDGVQWIVDFVSAFADTGVFDAWIDVCGVLLDIGDSVSDLFGSVLDTFGQMDGAGDSAQSFGTMVGDAFRGIADLVKPVLQKLDDLVNWFSEHSEFVVSALAGIGGAFAVFKTAQTITSVVDKFNGFRQAVLLATEATGGLKLSLPVIQDALKAIGTSAGPIGPALQGVVGKISGLSTAAKAAGGGIKGLSSALGLGPWGLVATAVAAVVSALVWFFTQTEWGARRGRRSPSGWVTHGTRFARSARLCGRASRVSSPDCGRASVPSRNPCGAVSRVSSQAYGTAYPPRGTRCGMV